MKVSDEIGKVGSVTLADRTEARETASIPASLEAYVATRTDNVTRTAAKLIEQFARTGLWTVVATPLEASFNMTPCPFGASLMLRRSNRLVSAAIVARTWSVKLLGDEAWVDVPSSRAVAISLIGTPVRARIEIPFLSPTLKVCGTSHFETYFRFHCR